VPYLQCQMSKPILCCAIAACPLDHRDANASVMKYLTDFLACATKKEVRTGCVDTDDSLKQKSVGRT
jgi:transportin-3